VPEKGKDDSWQLKADCHQCGKVGHIRPNCPQLKDGGDNQTDNHDASQSNLKDKKSVEKKKDKSNFCSDRHSINPKDLIDEERQQVLEYHLFLKEKRDATVKGRMVAGGNKQRGSIGKLDVSSPTATLESVLLTAVINAHEGLEQVAVVDIPNAFDQTRRRQSHYALAWEIGRADGQSGTGNLHQVRHHQLKRRNSSLCSPS
jgi:hypothetical protein